jgi:hypothetical protein
MSEKIAPPTADKKITSPKVNPSFSIILLFPTFVMMEQGIWVGG